MRCLVIYAHPHPESFNHAILETLTARLHDRGHEVRVRDLYALSFDPVLKASDLAELQAGRIPEALQAEQEHVRWAQTLIFISPIWWSRLPAILQGYFDRVFSLGFAYTFGPEGPRGLLSDKVAIVINTLGASEEDYRQSGMFNSIRQTLDQGVFQFCGARVAEHQFFGAVTSCSADQRRAMLDTVRALADRI